MDHTVSGYNAIAWNFLIGHVKIAASVSFKAIDFNECVLIQQPGYSLSGGQFAGFMLYPDFVLSPSCKGMQMFLLEFCKQFR
jgi:hypothetical protein